MPSIRRFRPLKCLRRALRFCRDHWRNQVMHQSIMIGPAANAIEPRLEEPKFALAEIAGEVLKKEDREDFLFQYAARKQLIRCSHEGIDARLVPDLAPITTCNAP